MYDPTSEVHFCLFLSVSFTSKFLPAFVQLSCYWTAFFFSFGYHTQRQSDADTLARPPKSSSYSWPLNLVVTSLLKTNEVRVTGPKQHHVGSQASGQLSPLNFIQSTALAQTHRGGQMYCMHTKKQRTYWRWCVWQCRRRALQRQREKDKKDREKTLNIKRHKLVSTSVLACHW